MRALVLALSVSLVSCVPLAAGERQSHEAKARELTRLTLEAGSMDVALGQLTHVMTRALVASADKQGRNEPTAEELQVFQTAFRAAFMRVAPPEAWEEVLFPIYMRHFSEDELQAQLEFLRTPSGRKMLQMQSQLSREGALAGQSLLRSRAAALDAALKEELTRINAQP